MGSLFRSEEMGLFQLFLHDEVAFDCVSELGELAIVQFRDLNSNINIYQRKFVNEVRRCNALEKKLDYLEKEIDKAGIPMLEAGESMEALNPKEIVEIETKIENTEHSLREVNENITILKRNLLELTEYKHVLHESHKFFEGEVETSSTESMSRALVKEDFTIQPMNAQLGFISGVVARERIHAFERMLWRSYRGNVLFRQTEIRAPLEDPSTGHLVYKSVFIIFFQDQLKKHVKKICDGFSATIYPSFESPHDRRQKTMTILAKIQDLHLVLGKTHDLKNTIMLAVAKHVKRWLVKVIKMKAIYHTCNSFNQDIAKECLISECWIPVCDIDRVKLALQRGMERSDSSVPPILNRIETKDDPPTFNVTNKFTHVFQVLIDAYGVANYREVNPAPYTIITFPFLFAVMFGDFGQGFIMFLFAFWMVLKEKTLGAKKIDNEIWRMIFNGRYIILLMGIFSVYTGFIYNEIFSVSVNLFGSHWNISVPVADLMTHKFIELDPKDHYVHSPYPVGMDPIWQMSKNKINFLNSYKMKLSIIIGVIHMLFGVSLSIFNFTYFNNKIELLVTFLPRIIFMLSLFFYLVFLIFIKWFLYAADHPIETGPGCAPSVLITFINMMLFTPGISNDPCSPWMYPGQENIQHMLVIVSLICVPWMLMAKPIIISLKQRTADVLPKNVEGKTSALNSKNIKHKEDMFELWIDQAIHTIEYVLGSLSHTASYLRLWALSLAHAQLSEVLWGMVMRESLKVHSMAGGFVIFLVFPLWAILTVGILILMEGLSAFLHTLRLHWVEFQSKFYSGAGYSFVPFSFKTILGEYSSQKNYS